MVAKECVCLLWPFASGQEEGMIPEGLQAAVVLKHCLSHSLLETLAIEKGQKGNSVCKSHRYFTFIAGDLVVYVPITFSGPGLNCCLYMSSGSQKKESHPMYSVDVCLASTFCL